MQPQSGSGIYWRLVDPYDQLVGGDYFSSQSFTLSSSGTYTVLVEGYPSNSAPSPFSFTVFTDADTNAPLTLGQTVTSAVTQPGQLNNYTFTLGAETNAVFDSLTNDGNLNWTLHVPSGAVINQRSFISSAAEIIGVCTLLDLSAGYYTLSAAR